MRRLSVPSIKAAVKKCVHYLIKTTCHGANKRSAIGSSPKASGCAKTLVFSLTLDRWRCIPYSTMQQTAAMKKDLHNDDGPTYGFDTLQIHAGAKPDPTTGARQTPIHQTTAYVFRDADHAAALFNLQEVGFIYSRLTNPTVAVLQERIATLEGGVGAVCCSSGHAAQIMAIFPLDVTGHEHRSL